MENKLAEEQEQNLKAALGEEAYLRLRILEVKHKRLSYMVMSLLARDPDTIQQAKGEIKELTEQLIQLKARNENGKE